MKYRLQLGKILLALACGLILGFHFWDYIFSGSVDLAHHYVLVSRLTEYGHLPSVDDPSLGEMRIYPRLSHQVASGFARILGSPLAGMQLVVLLSMIAIWAAIGFMLSTLPPRQARSTTLIALVGVVLAAVVFHLNFWGGEVVANYFFAQFFAQAVAVVTLVFALMLSRGGWSRFAVYGVLIIGIIVTEYAHLLPALELLGFLWLLAVFEQYRQPDRWSMRSLLLTAVFPIAGLVAVVVSPVFRAMALISENNGSLPLSHVPNNAALLALVVATLGSSILALRRWARLNDPDKERQQLAVKYFALLGLSISILCLLQFAALAFGGGSDYACRKYAFGMWTVLLINVSLLLVRPARSEEKAESRPRPIATALDYCAIALLVGGAVLAVFPRQKFLSLSNLISMERRLTTLKAAMPAEPPGTWTYAVQLPGEPAVIDYLFTVGLFKTARSENAMNVLLDRDLSGTSQNTVIVAEKDTSRYDVQACRLPSPDSGLAVIDGTCLAKTGPNDDVCRGNVPLAGLQYMQGFGRSEKSGTWTNGKEAVFHCNVTEQTHARPAWVRISGVAFVPSAHVQRASISVNGGVAHEFVFDGTKNAQPIVLPVPNSGPTITIKFLLPDAVSPRALGLSEDARQLGFFVTAIQFTDADGKPI